jgi:hypothetical protein
LIASTGLIGSTGGLESDDVRKRFARHFDWAVMQSINSWLKLMEQV